MSEKLEITKDGYLNLINKILENKLEERELALDRYRKTDEQMESPEQFVLMGKNAVSFLNLVALSTNDLAALAKEIKSLVYKEDGGGDANFSLPDNWKDAIIDRVGEVEKSRNSRKIEDTDEEK